MTGSPYTLLIAEDEPHDVEFLRRAFRKTGCPWLLRSVENGEEAISYLMGQGRFSDRQEYPQARLLITDLKMPHMNGLELLRWLQAHPDFKQLPTLVLTSSVSRSDVQAAYQLGARGYLVKPNGLEALEKLARAITDFWSLSLLPG